jgi:hypothetical protein
MSSLSAKTNTAVMTISTATTSRSTPYKGMIRNLLKVEYVPESEKLEVEFYEFYFGNRYPSLGKI